VKIREGTVKHLVKEFLLLIVQMNIYLVRQWKWRDEERESGNRTREEESCEQEGREKSKGEELYLVRNRRRERRCKGRDKEIRKEIRM